MLLCHPRAFYKKTDEDERFPGRLWHVKSYLHIRQRPYLSHSRCRKGCMSKIEIWLFSSRPHSTDCRHRENVNLLISRIHLRPRERATLGEFHFLSASKTSPVIEIFFSPPLKGDVFDCGNSCALECGGLPDENSILQDGVANRSGIPRFRLSHSVQRYVLSIDSETAPSILHNRNCTRGLTVQNRDCAQYSTVHIPIWN